MPMTPAPIHSAQSIVVGLIGVFSKHGTCDTASFRNAHERAVPPKWCRYLDGAGARVLCRCLTRNFARSSSILA